MSIMGHLKVAKTDMLLVFNQGIEAALIFVVNRQCAMVDRGLRAGLCHEE